MVLRLGIDYDGVIIDSTALKQQLCREWYDKELRPEDCTTRKAKHVIGEEEYAKIYQAIENTASIEKCMPVTGVVEAMQALARQYQLYIVTTLATRQCAQARAFMNQHNIPFHEWVSTKQQGKQKTKAEIMRELGLFGLVDDDIDNLTHVKGLALLLDRPTNQDLTVTPPIQRVSWPEAVQTITKYTSNPKKIAMCERL